MPDFATDFFAGALGTHVSAHAPNLGGPITTFPGAGLSLAVISPAGAASQANAGAQVLWYSGFPPSQDYDVSADIIDQQNFNPLSVDLWSNFDPASGDGIQAHYQSDTVVWTLTQTYGGAPAATASYTPGLFTGFSHTLLLRRTGAVAQLLVDGAVVCQIGTKTPPFTGQAGFGISGDGVLGDSLQLTNFHATTPATPPVFCQPASLNFAIYTPAHGLTLASLTLWYPSKNIVLKGPQADAAAAWLAANMPAALCT